MFNISRYYVCSRRRTTTGNTFLQKQTLSIHIIIYIKCNPMLFPHVKYLFFILQISEILRQRKSGIGSAHIRRIYSLGTYADMLFVFFNYNYSPALTARSLYLLKYSLSTAAYHQLIAFCHLLFRFRYCHPVYKYYTCRDSFTCFSA